MIKIQTNVTISLFNLKIVLYKNLNTLLWYTFEVDSSQIKLRGGAKMIILQELLLTVMAGVIVHLINKWLDSKDK